MNNPNFRLSISEKIGYGLGDTASCLFYQFFSMFLLFFYTDIFGIPAAAAGTMFLIIRIWDAFFDVMVGTIADRTQTRWGKFRPYLLFTAIPFGVIGVLTFTTPDLSLTGKMIYAYVTYTAMMMVYSLINIPYSALLGVLTPNSQDRTSLSSFKFIGAYTGSLIVQGCTIYLVNFFGQGDEKHGYQMALTTFAILAVILFFITFFSTKERINPVARVKSSLKSDFKDLKNNTPWILLFTMGLLFLVYCAIRNGATIFYFKYYVGDQNLKFLSWGNRVTGEYLATIFMITGIIGTLVGTMLLSVFTKLFGKKQLYFYLMLATSITTGMFYFLNPHQVLAAFALNFIISFVSGPAAALIWAMYADTADYSEWKNGGRATGLIFSAAIMSQKFGWTIGGALPGWILSAFGYLPNTAQSPEVLTGLVLMMSFIPIIGTVAAAVVVRSYSLDEAKMKEIETGLINIRNK
jgi:GPH family glycoside/pentoside/hexuronide:cation symporter